MDIYPAIDLKDNKAVRLTKGDYNRCKVYDERPVNTALKFLEAGASHLHIVDLDGAAEGEPVNLQSIRELLSVKGLSCEVGGGIRDERRVEMYLGLGAERVILGTAAVKNYPFLKQMVKKYGDKIAVGVDAKDGLVAVEGWLETSGVDAVGFCRQLTQDGVKTVIFTDISRDGMLSGCNLPSYELLNKIEGLAVVASGGITSLFELERLKAMGCAGAIVGKAVYEGALTLSDCLVFER